MQQLREIITDTLLFTYYYLELENSKIPVLLPRRPALCIYFYLPPPPSLHHQRPKWIGHHFWDILDFWNNQTEDGTPVGIHPR